MKKVVVSRLCDTCGSFVLYSSRGKVCPLQGSRETERCEGWYSAKRPKARRKGAK